MSTEDTRDAEWRAVEYDDTQALADRLIRLRDEARFSGSHARYNQGYVEGVRQALHALWEHTLGKYGEEHPAVRERRERR